MRSDQRKIISEAESELARRLAELETEPSPSTDPASSLWKIFQIIFEDKLNPTGHGSKTTFTLNDIERFDVEEHIVRRFIETREVVKDLSQKYMQLKRSQALDKITREIEDFKQDIEKEGVSNLYSRGSLCELVIGSNLWQSEQQRIQTGWAENGELRKAFFEEQQKSAKCEEDLILRYIRDQVDCPLGDYRNIYTEKNSFYSCSEGY